MSRKDITDEAVVWAAVRRQEVGGFVDAILCEQTGECLKVCHRAMERAQDRGLIECGVSLRTCWPTVKGLALIQLQEKLAK